CSRKPETRARRSTDSNGSVVPVYSRYCVTGFSTGLATVTSGGGGGTNALTLGLQPAMNVTAAVAVTSVAAVFTQTKLHGQRVGMMDLRRLWVCRRIRRVIIASWIAAGSLEEPIIFARIVFRGEDVAPVGARAHFLDGLRRHELMAEANLPSAA